MDVFHLSRMTCRHFRYQVPREYADELRDADTEPCPVCDALPHRKARMAGILSLAPIQRVKPPQVAKSGWRTRLFGDRQEVAMPGAVLPTPVRVPA
jgi:hypothetical protein